MLFTFAVAVRCRDIYRSIPSDERHPSIEKANVNTRALIELMEQAELLRQEQESERNARATEMVSHRVANALVFAVPCA